MAGIGVKLNKIFEKNTITTNLIGFGYSAMITVAPMFLVISNILLMGKVLGLSKVAYVPRELFASTVLYIFIFALLVASPFNAVLSRYVSDVIYEERYEDILPCFEIGLFLNVALSCIIGIPFCIHEYFVGKVDIFYVFTGYCGYISLVLVFYSVLYLYICKDYKKVSFFYLLGMLAAFLLSLFFVFVLSWNVPYSMLLSLVIGFYIIASLELAMVKRYFKKNSRQYKKVLGYFLKYWKLVFANFLYVLGLYIHNFVFWGTDLKMIVVKSFISAPPYDMATCIAMFTNISATVIFISRIEMHFHERYRAYSEAVIGGRGSDIAIAKDRMFGQLSTELMNLVRIQFIISVVVYLICIVILPQIGFAGMVMQIYPCLAAGYFILFIMYSAIIFLYYFNDLTGAVLTAGIFFLGTLLGSIFSTYLPVIWYGIGVIIGSCLGWSMAYMRLRWIERNMNRHIFCRGRMLSPRKGEQPSGKVYAACESAEEQGGTS